MDIVQDIDSIANFKRRTKSVLRRLRETGHPVVLTRNGRAEVVVQSAKAYQRMMELFERMETVDALAEAFADIEAGRVQPADEAFEEIRQKYKIPRRA